MHAVTAADIEIPALGFGTWQVQGDDARRMVEAALEIGYRHIDTAAVYGNEVEVGRGLAGSGMKRDEVFLTTKIWVDSFAQGDLQRAAQASLERLGVERVDLLLLHWPKPLPPLEETIAALNDVRSRGWTRAIGLSNFPSALWRQAQALSSAPLVTNQVEYHPFLTQKTLLATARELGSSLTAWSPLAQGKVAQDPVLQEIAAAHGKSPGQVALRWLVQQPRVVAIPRTTKAERARENFAIWDFELSPDEMARIRALGAPGGRLGDWIDPAFSWDPE